VFEARPDDILRVFYLKQRSTQIRDILKWCREHRLPYRELDGESLNKVAKGTHHEGLVIVVRPAKLPSAMSLARKGLAPGTMMVALDGIDNSHNVGAILRTCAFFNAAGMILHSKETSMISPSMARTAEGALETVPLYDSKNLASTLRDLKNKNVFVVGADLKADRSLYDLEIPRPCVVVLGNEQKGLSKQVRQRCDAVVRIPGSSLMQSLNVSVAAGVVLAELARRQQTKKKSR